MGTDTVVPSAASGAETSTTVTYPRLDQHIGTLGSGGQLLPGYVARVIKPDGSRATYNEPGELFIVDQLEVGARVVDDEPVAISHDEGNGPLYPFSLAQKLGQITEPHPWYTPDGGRTSPWGRAIVPVEMISVLANKVDKGFPVRAPTLGLFLDLEIRLLAGPVFVDEPYSLEHEIVGTSQSRRTESYWTRTTSSGR